MYPLIDLGNAILIPTYSLILSLVFCLSLILMFWTAKRNNLNEKTALDLGLVFIVSGFIGARAMHVLYESPTFYLSHPLQIFYIWQGGFVYYGGVLLAILASVRFLKSKGESPLLWFDLMTPLFSLTYALGRWACLMAGCCYGKVCDLPWALPFLDEHGGVLRRHPTQVYLIVWEFLVLAVLLRLKHNQNKATLATKSKQGSLFFTWLSLHALGRFFIEFYRDDFRGVTFGVSISSWISLAILGISVSFLIRKKTSNQ